MKKRIVVYRNKYLDARRFHVQELAKAAELEPPYESINPKDTVIEGKLKSIADEFHVSVSCIATSLQKAKYVPFGKQKFTENDAYWISEEEVGSSNIKEARKEKARSLLEQGWPVNAVNEYTGLSFYSLYRMSEEIEKSLGYLEKGREGKVFSLWAKGLSQTDIANKLGITRQTVNSDLKKYKQAFVALYGEEEWEKHEKQHNTNCSKGKGTKKSDYANKVKYGKVKEIIKSYINAEGNLLKSIAFIESETDVNTKTVQKLVLLILMENNLIDRAVEFAIGIVGQPEIIRPALKLCASKNESFNAVKFVLVEREELKNDKKSTDIKTLVIDVKKQIKLKTEIKNKINKDGSLKVSIAEMEKEFKLNTKTVQKFVLLTLMEKNLTERAVEFAVGIIGQPEIIKLALNHFASENEEYEENENYKAVNYVFDKRVDLKKEKKQLNDTKALVDKVLERIKQGHLEKMYIKQKRKRAYRWLLN